jgi:hypothetical protein
MFEATSSGSQPEFTRIRYGRMSACGELCILLHAEVDIDLLGNFSLVDVRVNRLNLKC